jgi:maltose/moltooligosaccharide transporter
MFANYNLIAAIAAFLLPLLPNISRKFTHFAAPLFVVVWD